MTKRDPFQRAVKAAKQVIGAGEPTNRAERRKQQKQKRILSTGLRHKETPGP